MRKLTRDGTAEPVSRNQILRRERGQRIIHFPCSASDHEQDWQPCPVVRAIHTNIVLHTHKAGRPGSSEVPRNPLTRWDVSSIPANGIFLTKKRKKKRKKKMPNGWRTIKSLVHKIRLHGRRGKGMAESFSREKLRHAPQKEGG